MDQLSTLPSPEPETHYVLRSRRSGRYFKFVQYADDGWGMYEDNVSAPFHNDDMPDFFLARQVIPTPHSGSSCLPWLMLAGDHKPEDVDIIEVRLSFTLVTEATRTI